jgi:fructan beta-fructosidase
MSRARLMTGTLAIALAMAGAHAADDLLIEDFENEGYRHWTATGEAFGPGPAQGALPGQMPLSGYRGARLVNTFFNGDGTTGTLTSPPIEIRRDYIGFLIGGGGYGGKTCINLLLNGEVVRTAVGPNTEPGGSERLEAQFWDVRDLRGCAVEIQIVDRATGGWGHINVDHIVQTDERPKIPEYRALERSFRIDYRYLVIPIKNGVSPTELTLEVDGQAIRRYTTELAIDPGDVDWYAYFTIEAYSGRTARVAVGRGTAEAFSLVRAADEVPGAAAWYTEPLRPQIHFSQAVGWNNDPNGMVYLDGEWHLFFQHNPVGWKWGNMTWGHAVSRDLVHWEQLPNVLFPGTMATGACYSGGGIVDSRNTAGWRTDGTDVLAVFLTDTGAGESVAFSNDNGRTFRWHEGNPVVRHRGRDPKVIWYAYEKGEEPLDDRARRLGGHWVMAVYDEHDELGQNIAFFTSVDLKGWTERSHLPGYYECPEIFELPVDESSGETRWVVFAADGRYALGAFDGMVFMPDHEGKHRVHWGPYYASQTFENAPDGRRIQMGWVRIAAPGMPFNQGFSFPHELTLRSTEDGVRMFAEPVREIETIYKESHTIVERALSDDRLVGIDVAGELFDVRATYEIGTAARVGFTIGGNRIVYDAAAAMLGEAPLGPIGGCVSIRALVDRTMIEVGGNDGAVCITMERELRGDAGTVEAFAEGGDARLVDLRVFELESIWSRED